MAEFKTRLSASRIDTFLLCSWLYYAKYKLKIPDKGNDGANRGSVTHDVLEILLNPRHEHHVKKIMKDRTCRNDESVWRLVEKKARQYGVGSRANLDMINSFILVGLFNDFFGDSFTKKILPEEMYEFKVEEDGKRYFIVARIDKIFVKEHGGGTFIEIVDYKTSSRKFEGKKIDFNIQEFVYTLAAKKMFPEAKSHELSFLFLKFPKDPQVSSQPISDEELDGFEYYLTDLQSLMEDFTEEDASKNFAARKGYLPEEYGFCGMKKCGYAKKPGQLKKDGTPYYHCEAKFPFNYFVIEKDGKILRSAFDEEDLKCEEGETIVRKEYKGCKYFYPNNY